MRKPQKNYKRGPYIGRFHLIDWRNSREAPIRIGPKPSLPRGGRRRPPSGGGTGATAGRGGEPSAQWPIERALEKCSTRGETLAWLIKIYKYKARCG